MCGDLEIGDRVFKHSGDYGGWGTVEDVLVTRDGRIRYLVSYKIEGPDSFGSILHINNRNQLKKIEEL